ncbi:hypothetical protein [Mesorhizobium sp. 128a]
MNTVTAYRMFEQLCVRLFAAKGFEVRPQSLENGVRVDASAQRGDEQIRAELIVVTFLRPTLGFLRDKVAGAKAQLRQTRTEAKHIAILSSKIEPVHLDWLQTEFAIEVWDRDRIQRELDQLSPKATALKRDFALFFRRLRPLERLNFGRSLGRPITKHQDQDKEISGLEPAPKPSLAEAPGPFVAEEAGQGELLPSGAELRNRLTVTKEGQEQATEYEVLVQEIVRYLFGTFLVDARPHRRTEDDLDIMDITYRVRAGHPFWDTLTRDFRTRAIVFECKNYSKGITPSQIYSTERYVNVGALRSVCFLVSRKKPHEHAELAAFGAMREGGKLFVLLHDLHLHQMLNIREAQLRREAEGKSGKRSFEDDPAEVLDQVIYDFLTRMGR